jgi:hypothetical protein
VPRDCRRDAGATVAAWRSEQKQPFSTAAFVILLDLELRFVASSLDEKLVLRNADSIAGLAALAAQEEFQPGADSLHQP